MEKSNHPNFSNKDQDKRLTKLFEEHLENRDKSLKTDDPVFNTLLKIREEDAIERKDIPVRGKESSWQSISQTIRQQGENDTRPNATITPIHSRRSWLKVAAAIVLIASSALLLVQQFSISDKITVAEASSAVQTIELGDGSTVTLRPNSTLSKFTDSENPRSYSLSGEAVFDVITDPDRVFTVEAGAGRVVVTGTRFNLNARNQISQVYLFEGSVRFEAADGSDSVNLEPGEASGIDMSMQIQEPFEFDTEIVTGWTRNRLTFRDRQAGSIMSELEFHFNIEIIASQDVREESLGGTIQLDNAEQSLSDLGIVLGGSFEETGEGVYEFKSSGN